MSKEDENNDLDTIIVEAEKNAESDFLKRLYLQNNLPKRKFFLSLLPLIGIIPRMWRNWQPRQTWVLGAVRRVGSSPIIRTIPIINFKRQTTKRGGFFIKKHPPYPL